MLLALAFAGFLSDCVPARWFSADPKSLELLSGSPINCLLVERQYWTPPLIDAGHRHGLKMLAVLESPSATIPPDADAAVFEGDPPSDRPPSDRPPPDRPPPDRPPSDRLPSYRAATVKERSPLLILGTRDHIRPAYGIAGTTQGVWPGIRVDDKALAGPTAAPWIDTNLGFLRYVSSHLHETIWLANRPPPDKTISLHPCQKALADAWLAGARWVISPGDGFAKRLLAGDQSARKDWDDLMALAKFLESQPHVHGLDIYSHLGVSVNRETGAFVSGGVLDMIGAQHIPFHVVKNGDGMAQFFDFADNSIVKFPPASLGGVAMRPGDTDGLEPVYRRVEVIVGRTNYGLRVFNGAGLLSAPYVLAGNRGVLVLIANYTDYPAEDITLHVLGHWKKATLDSPDGASQPLTMYPVKEATAIEIPKLTRIGAVHVE